MWGRPESTALRSDKGLDVLYSTPARFVSLAPCISGHLRALASRPGEKCELKTKILQRNRRPEEKLDNSTFPDDIQQSTWSIQRMICGFLS